MMRRYNRELRQNSFMAATISKIILINIDGFCQVFIPYIFKYFWNISLCISGHISTYLGLHTSTMN